MAGNGSLPLGQELWQDTRVIQPFDTASSCYRNVFTGEILTLDQREGLLTLALKDIFSVYPVAMLERIGRTGETA
jgi:maltooligosyltrehalose synthase